MSTTVRSIPPSFGVCYRVESGIDDESVAGSLATIAVCLLFEPLCRHGAREQRSALRLLRGPLPAGRRAGRRGRVL